MTFRKIVDSVIVPEFTPKSGVKVQISDSEPVPQSSGGGKSFEWLSFTAVQLIPLR